jgi:hypothetical protein
MRLSAIDSFKVKATFYRSQKDYCTDWLTNALAETITATLATTPVSLLVTSRYRDAVPEITAMLRSELQIVLEGLSKVQLDVVPKTAINRKNTRGRPQEIPDERKERALVAKKEGATSKQLAAILYDTKRPSTRQRSDVSNILKHYQSTKKS